METPTVGQLVEDSLMPHERREIFGPGTKPGIKETETYVSYLGVPLKKAEKNDGILVPKKQQYEDYINDDFSLKLQQKMAVSFLQGEPILIEGGTSIGKTTTVKKMASDLGWEVHYVNLSGATDVEDLMGRYVPNRDKKSESDPEYIFADGSVTSGLRQEEGKTKVIILDEFNASAPNILIRLHEVLDAMERNGSVILSEDASETIPVNKEKTKIIALMNPPGKGYFERNALDPAQIRRWVYQKELTNLDDSTFSNSLTTLFGTKSKESDIANEFFIEPREYQIPVEEISSIPGIEELLVKFSEFHKSAQKMVSMRKVAQDQPQPFTFDDRVEPRRVRDFISRFYSGDINATMQKALKYYYLNKLESDVDRKSLEEIIRTVNVKTSSIVSKRKSLDSSEVKKETAATKEKSAYSVFLNKFFDWAEKNGCKNREEFIWGIANTGEIVNLCMPANGIDNVQDIPDEFVCGTIPAMYVNNRKMHKGLAELLAYLEKADNIHIMRIADDNRMVIELIKS